MAGANGHTIEGATGDHHGVTGQDEAGVCHVGSVRMKRPSSPRRDFNTLPRTIWRISSTPMTNANVGGVADAPFNDHASYFDFYVFVTHYAPNFPEEDFLDEGEQLALDRAFELLRHGLQFIKPALSDAERQAAGAVLDEAHVAFAKGDDVAGLRVLHGYEQELFRRTDRGSSRSS